jgi:hypothetical protein
MSKDKPFDIPCVTSVRDSAGELVTSQDGGGYLDKTFTVHLSGLWEGRSNTSKLISITQVSVRSKNEAQERVIKDYGGKYIKQPIVKVTDGVFSPNGYTHDGKYLLSAVAV